jgi:hypothetical protein
VISVLIFIHTILVYHVHKIITLVHSRAYQSVILEPKVQCQFDHMRELHVLDKNEDGHDRSWECIKVLKYSEERTADFDIDHRCLVEWNDLNRSQSWVNFFALCLSKRTPIISFAKDHKLLEKSPFCHIIPNCKSKPSLNMSKACNVSTIPTTIKYKFGIQVPRGIKNAISLDKKNKNHLWHQTIQTELKKLTDYETFMILDSGEDIP